MSFKCVNCCHLSLTYIISFKSFIIFLLLLLLRLFARARSSDSMAAGTSRRWTQALVSSPAIAWPRRLPPRQPRRSFRPRKRRRRRTHFYGVRTPEAGCRRVVGGYRGAEDVGVQRRYQVRPDFLAGLTPVRPRSNSYCTSYTWASLRSWTDSGWFGCTSKLVPVHNLYDDKVGRPGLDEV